MLIEKQLYSLAKKNYNNGMYVVNESFRCIAG